MAVTPHRGPKRIVVVKAQLYQRMLVAEGCGEIALDAKMQPWDVAAVKIIVEEAGGTSTSYTVEDSISVPNLVSTNGHLHAAVLGMIGS